MGCITLTMQRKSSKRPQTTSVLVYCFILNAPTIREELLRVLASSSSQVVDRVLASREAGLPNLGVWVASARALQHWEEFHNPPEGETVALTSPYGIQVHVLGVAVRCETLLKCPAYEERNISSGHKEHENPSANTEDRRIQCEPRGRCGRTGECCSRWGDTSQFPEAVTATSSLFLSLRDS